MTGLLDSTINGIYQPFRSGGSNVGSVNDFLGIAVNFLLAITFALSFVGIAFAFVQFILSRGDKDAVSKAKNALTWSVVALLISFFVLVLKNLLYGALGLYKVSPAGIAPK